MDACKAPTTSTELTTTGFDWPFNYFTLALHNMVMSDDGVDTATMAFILLQNSFEFLLVAHAMTVGVNTICDYFFEHPYTFAERPIIPDVAFDHDTYPDANAMEDFRFTCDSICLLREKLNIPTIFKTNEGDRYVRLMDWPK